MQSEPAAIVTSILRNLMSHAPMLLVALGGLLLALTNWRKWPRASALLALGCGVHLAIGLGMPVIYGILPHVVRSSGANLGTIYTVLSFMWGLLSAGGFALIILAVYAGRPAMLAKTIAE